MPLISRKTIEEIRQRVNLLDVVQPYVQLRRVGSSYRGLSPFNPEKTPSFYVHPDRGFFKCFSSGQGGDLFQFIQIVENLDFQEAVETIARKFSIPLEYEAGAQPAADRSLRQELFDLHEVATAHFRECFLATREDGAFIRSYWEQKRRFLPATAESFRVGFAPADGGGLAALLQRRRFSPAAILASGLFFGQERDLQQGRLKARFRGRLMIPILDVQGRIVAFTARQTDLTPPDDPAHDAKYVNSPETPIFIKSHILFGLDRARTRVDQTGVFLMVEGQLDAVRCYENNLGAVVASQGTAVTPDHLQRLKRYADRLEVFLDGDNAGQKAALRLLPLAFQAGLETRFLPLDPGQDPDSFIRDQGADVLPWLRARSLSAFAFAVRHLGGNDPHSLPPGQKIALLEQLFQILAALDSSVLRQDFLAELASLLRAPQPALQRDFERFLATHVPRARPSAPTDPASPGPHSSPSGDSSNPASSPSPDASFSSGRENIPNRKLTSIEADIILLLFHCEHLGKAVALTINPDWISLETVAGRLLQRFLADFEHDAWPGVAAVPSLLEDPEEFNLIADLRLKQFKEDTIRFSDALNDAIRRLHRRFLDRESADLSRRMANLPPDSPEYQDLFRRKSDLLRQARQPPTLPA